MEPSLPEVQPNNYPKKLITWWLEPFLWGFIVLAVTGLIVSSIESAAWLPGLLLILAAITASILVLFFSRKLTPPPVEIPRPSLECWIMVGYYIVFMFLSTLTKGEGIFGNEFEKWLWFIILPILLVFILRGSSRNLKAVLQSVGLRRQGLSKAILIALLAYAVTVPVIPFIIPESQLQSLQELFQEPLKAMAFLPLCFLLSLVTAAGTEEIFFRGILQPCLTLVMRSELRGCLITAFLFGIYHLPYAYFSTSWPTHGNMLWAVSSVLAEQMVTGLLLGILWLRTHNIAAPVLFHALVNTIAFMTMLKFG